jgi:hypothetical protein
MNGEKTILYLIKLIELNSRLLIKLLKNLFSKNIIYCIKENKKKNNMIKIRIE